MNRAKVGRIRRVGRPAGVHLTPEQAQQLSTMNRDLENARQRAAESFRTMQLIAAAVAAKLTELGLDPKMNPVWDRRGLVRYVDEKDLPKAIAELERAG